MAHKTNIMVLTISIGENSEFETVLLQGMDILVLKHHPLKVTRVHLRRLRLGPKVAALLLEHTTIRVRAANKHLLNYNRSF